MWDTSALLGALTPKFYVALTGTSSLLSGIILIFEWWYYRKYGTSFVEHLSLAQISPWFGGGDSEPRDTGECKVWRNPMALLRGAEYARLWTAARRAPLTYYDMNLSAQDHQAWFCCGAEGPAEEVMAAAWREREPAARVAAARAALELRPDCAAALLLLAEEDAPTVQEAERVLKRAWRAAETSWRAALALCGGTGGGACGGAGGGGAGCGRARRAHAVLAHVKRRAAMCARRLGRLRDAARLFRELARDAPPALHSLALHENLIEVLLEQRLYADVAALLARLEAAPSAATRYTAALLRARHAAARPADPRALEEIRKAIEYNPYVPEYLLELRPLTFPPEHVVPRGDSEAVAYAFFHLRHWRAADGALQLLEAAGGAGGGAGAGPAGGAAGGAGGAASVDRELLPAHHAWAARGAGWALPAGCALCAVCAACALAAAGAGAGLGGGLDGYLGGYLEGYRWPVALQPRRLLALFTAF